MAGLIWLWQRVTGTAPPDNTGGLPARRPIWAPWRPPRHRRRVMELCIWAAGADLSGLAAAPLSPDKAPDAVPPTRG